MRTLIAAAALAVAASIPAPAMAGDTMDGIRSDCLREWPGDYSMQEFCIRKQTDALNAMIIDAGGSFDKLSAIEKDIFGKCAIDWTTPGGYDWAMVKFCSDKQRASYVALNGPITRTVAVKPVAERPMMLNEACLFKGIPRIYLYNGTPGERYFKIGKHVVPFDGVTAETKRYKYTLEPGMIRVVDKTNGNNKTFKGSCKPAQGE